MKPEDLNPMPLDGAKRPLTKSEEIKLERRALERMMRMAYERGRTVEEMLKEAGCVWVWQPLA